MSERKGAMLLLGIIAIASLGLSGYMFVTSEILITPGTTSPDSGLILVGLWDDLATNKEYAPYIFDHSWLIEVGNNQFNNSNYIEVSNNNTSFKLIEEGFYKITLLLLLNSVEPSTIYYVRLLRNNVVDHSFVRIAMTDNPISSAYQTQSSVYVKSNGLDNFTIRCHSISDAFEVYDLQLYNQLTIEYHK